MEYLTEWPPQEQVDDSGSVKEKSLAETKSSFGENNLKRSWSKFNEQSGEVKKFKSSSVSTLSTIARQLISSDCSVLPDVILSRWWKKEGGGVRHTFLSQSNNPRTLLYHIARLPEGQDILWHRVTHLQQQLSEVPTPEEWLLHFNLASCHHKLGSDLHNITLALTHAREAVQLHLGEPDVEWLVELLVRQGEVEERKKERESDLLRADLVFSMPRAAQVERRRACDLSLSQFITEYALTHTPVVITGLVGHMTTTPWTLDHIRKVVGDKVAPVRRVVKGSVQWAGLESAGSCTVSEFIDSLDTNQDKRYLFDWGLPLNCPELASELSIPKYFANDFLQRTPEGSLYRDSWPSLFMAPAGITSELHVDAFGSNFWMALFEGRKRWVFFPPEDMPLLYPVYVHSTDAVFKVDLSSPDHTHHPLVTLTHPQECILGPGEVLYVPAGCPHRVENLEQSLAISANFVNCSNFDLVKKELCVNALVDECAKQLMEVMQNEVFDAGMRGLGSSHSNLNGIETLGVRNETSVAESRGRGGNTEKSTGKALETDTLQLCVSWADFKQQNIHDIV